MFLSLKKTQNTYSRTLPYTYTPTVSATMLQRHRRTDRRTESQTTVWCQQPIVQYCTAAAYDLLKNTTWRVCDSFTLHGHFDASRWHFRGEWHFRNAAVFSGQCRPKL